MSFDVLTPQWSAPSHVKAVSTLRCGGVSQGGYESLNLGAHVGDDVQSGEYNRQRLQDRLNLPSTPVWLEQVHGCQVVTLGGGSPLLDIKADASFSARPGVVCAVLTADCLPVVFTNRMGTKVAVAHAGWRGLAEGVLESTVETMAESSENLIAWLGPAIGPSAFEVGEEVVAEFTRYLPIAEQAFLAQSQAEGKWLADIYMLARQRLEQIGVTEISGGVYCTYTDSEKFFSYRRSGVTGRMATLVWIDGHR